MDINDQLAPVVASILDNLKVSIEQEIRDRVSQEIISKVASTEINSIIETITTKQLTERLTKYNFEATTKTQLDGVVSRFIDSINTNIVPKANTQIAAEINKQLAGIDIRAIVSNIVENKLVTLVTSGAFPQSSIPHTSINFKGLRLTGDQIQGGIIEKFGSTGIEDLASHVQMTLMDHAVAFEGPIYSPEIQVRGNVIIDGELVVNGDINTDTPVFGKLIHATSDRVRETLNDELFSGFSNIIFDKIQTEGIELDRIMQAGKEVVNGKQLGYHITDTNIQRVGMLRDLQTLGESYLSSSLYVTEAGRIGINTIDPSAVLSIWDEEVEINVSKRGQDTGYISTPRFQKLVLGSNGKQNLVLATDGGVEIDNLSVGTVKMSSAPTVPNYAGELGQIVWNSNPMQNGSIGWVCLGDTRWAKFGKIE